MLLTLSGSSPFSNTAKRGPITDNSVLSDLFIDRAGKRGRFEDLVKWGGSARRERDLFDRLVTVRVVNLEKLI